MNANRLLPALLLLGSTLVGGVVYFRLLGPSNAARAQPVPRGDHEIAWIHAATNSATWERFVAGARQVATADLSVDTRDAFPEQTTRVPEVSFQVAGKEPRLRVRWYKLTSEMGIQQWVAELARREPPPLAIIGGGSSDRARDLALALRHQQEWRGSPPLLLITTATANTVTLEGEPNSTLPQESVKLTDVYPGRTFRFCFQNSQMAEAVVDFVWSQPDLRPHADPTRPDTPAPVFTFCWEDDPYSIDLAERFQTTLRQPERGRTLATQYNIHYSVGDYNEPNRRETELITKLAQDIAHAPRQRRLLVLPTLVQPARRVLRKMTVAAPAAVSDLIAVTGDSINFNNIYRDRDVAWNVQEIPVTLVFFCHQDPVFGPEFDRPEAVLSRRQDSATDDVRLNADLMELVLNAAPFPDRTPTADEFARNLRLARRSLLDPAAPAGERDQPFFGSDGNRLGGSGEYVVCLRPRRKGAAVLPAATVEVWRRLGSRDDGMRWQLHKSFPILYDMNSPEEGLPDAGR